MSAGGKVAYGLVLGMLGASWGACGWGQKVSPTCDLCLDLAPESLRERPVRAVQQQPRRASGTRSRFKGLKPWPREGR